MAKFRFPGKALKLNNRKRVKFRLGDEENIDEHRISQIKSGLILFNQLFGESDEDDEDDDFIGFEHPDDKTVFKKKKKKTNTTLCSRDKIESDCIQTDSPVESNKCYEEDTCLSIAINGFLENAPKAKAVIPENNPNCDDKDLSFEGLDLEQVKEPKKLCKETSERISKKFILPSVSARSSRIIKPNKRLFSDFTVYCSTNQQEKELKAPISTESTGEQQPPKVISRVKHIAHESDDDDVKENDPVCRSILFYTDSITEEFKGQVGRPPKKLLKKGDFLSKEEHSALNISLSPSKGPKEEKVKEKIEKLLRSPWNNRIKSSKGIEKETDGEGGCISLKDKQISKSIIRKARLHLSKQTLQKIRSPASVQCLVPLSEDEAVEKKCGLCQSLSYNTVCRYGVSCCDTCSLSINFFTEDLSTNLECIGEQGECQLVGLSLEERCLSCWLSRILVTCAMPSLLHDRLRNSLPSIVKDKIPSSLGRSCAASTSAAEDGSIPDGKGDKSIRNFGSLIDLPGGWKRKTGRDVVVISPSGEKFRSIVKLEDYLRRQGINAQASVLFGNLNQITSNVERRGDAKQSSKFPNKINNVVVTTLPGGWTRRIKWRNTGDTFDTYVCSPDGRTFRSRKELGSYFQHIGKVDDIYKYFPVKTSNASCTTSSENSEASSTEPISTPEESADEKSPHESDSEEEEIADQTQMEEILSQSRVGNPANEKLVDNDSENLVSEESTDNFAGKKYKNPEKLIISSLHSHLQNCLENSFKEQKEELSVEDNEKPPSIELSNLASRKETLSSEKETSGINLNIFSRKKDPKCADEMQAADPGNIVLKIKPTLSQPSDSGKESSGSKHKKKKKKKKRKHEKHLKDKRKYLELEKHYPLVCDVDKIKTIVTEVASHAVQRNDDLQSSNFKGSSPVLFRELTVSSIPCHPNDTWQTLISSSIPASTKIMEETTEQQQADIELVEKPIDRADENIDSIKLDKKALDQSQRRRLPGFTREQFGNGWRRKIKWNDKGEGKVFSLISPEGQKIVSSIELLAYFKKAGKTMLNLDHYFPKDLVRIFSEEKDRATETSNGDALQRLSSSQTSNESQLIEMKRRPKPALGKKALKNFKGSIRRLKLNVVKKAKMEGRKGPPGVIEQNAGTDIGPRVKHVCRSKAQVLGMPRAVFPSPEFKLKRQGNDFIKEKRNERKRTTKFLSVVTPKGKRVLKKTVWCNKCPGCTTPNCMICGNCLDMKKYGGPGLKKKPCIKRKCHNPTRAIKCVIYTDSSQEGEGEENLGVHDVTERESVQIEESSVGAAIKFLSCANSELEMTSEIPSEKEVKLRKFDCKDRQNVTNEVAPSVDRPIFIPKRMKPSNEVKDRGDIPMGKEFIPGTKVNIDYWQEYDAEEMLMSGFPIVTSVPLEIESFCFRCGSAGLEELLYCIWCCEGFHPFCLEEGEGPESEEEEFLWVCRKCAVCHVCGGSGHYDLHQCNGCRRNFHLECLGPTSHQLCQPSQVGIWMSDVWLPLTFSWPKQTPIIRVKDPDLGVSVFEEEPVTLFEQLENLHSLYGAKDLPLKEERYLLPAALAKQGTINVSLEKKNNIFVESVCIEDTFADLAEGDHICLEDAFEGLEELNSPALVHSQVYIPKDEEVVSLLRNVDLRSAKHSDDDRARGFVKRGDDEYLCLNYKKILPFSESPTETSLRRILGIINSELFEYLGYPSCEESQKAINRETSSPPDDKLDISKSDVMDVHLSTAIFGRRTEVQRAIKNWEEMRIQEERRKREMEREKSRKKRRDSLREPDGGESKLSRKRVKGRRKSSTSKDGQESFVEYSDQASGGLWQPNSWEEFDALFSSFSNKDEAFPHKRSLLKTPSNEWKRKRRKRSESLSPGQRKAKKLRLSLCSVKVTRLELKKIDTSRKYILPKKSPIKRTSGSADSSPVKKKCRINTNNKKKVLEEEMVDSKVLCIEKSDDVQRELRVDVISSGALEDFPDTVVCNISSVSIEELLSEPAVPLENGETSLMAEPCKEDILTAETVIEITESEMTPAGGCSATPGDESAVRTDSLEVGFDRPSTRPRRLAFGRASELASLRKAMMDI